MKSISYLLVNFGGPRSLEEVEEFLVELLTDQEVVRTSFPGWFHRWFFTRIAKKRALKVAEDYEFIGGKSPIFEDTQAVASAVKKELGSALLTFHRYLPKTHAEFIDQIKQWQDVESIRVVPMFPQFSDATTGSIAKWFVRHLPKEIVRKMSWVKSYPTHPGYIAAMQQKLKRCLDERGWQEQEVVLLFSAHGVPQLFVASGDPYQRECELSYAAVKSAFPHALSYLCYQSQFGKQPWIQPYTSSVIEEMGDYLKGRNKVVIIPLSFTSDHIETLFEIEELYVKVLQDQGIEACRCEALNLSDDWIEVVRSFFKSPPEELNTCAIYRRCPEKRRCPKGRCCPCLK